MDQIDKYQVDRLAISCVGFYLLNYGFPEELSHFLVALLPAIKVLGDHCDVLEVVFDFIHRQIELDICGAANKHSKSHFH